MRSNTPTVGAFADHLSGQLDPRPVAEVSKDLTKIRLQIGSVTTAWIPADNYSYITKD